MSISPLALLRIQTWTPETGAPRQADSRIKPSRGDRKNHPGTELGHLMLQKSAAIAPFSNALDPFPSLSQCANSFEQSTGLAPHCFYALHGRGVPTGAAAAVHLCRLLVASPAKRCYRGPSTEISYLG